MILECVILSTRKKVIEWKSKQEGLDVQTVALFMNLSLMRCYAVAVLVAQYEHVIHIDTFWTFVEELNIQEVEAKKILEDSFIKFQNRAWNVIKMLKRRAEDRIDEFEELEIIEAETEQSLRKLKDLTFEVLRDSWITQTDPME